MSSTVNDWLIKKIDDQIQVSADLLFCPTSVYDVLMFENKRSGEIK